jgi:hypothetical protein
MVALKPTVLKPTVKFTYQDYSRLTSQVLAGFRLDPSDCRMAPWLPWRVPRRYHTSRVLV